ncbi:hypothetical protein GCM10011506_05970 [Marivirga lumbricoides]|uniref:Uncharacterized protein n=1 Tax=Marivirga lumbricoides TaxID=1046115 RepID=A0A2T4DRS8_9BACT|nr:hypothetical protein C9994_07065 [Marivirga lumbricoides]GGC23485.1 hypothetical protein GCM10011506_05970 [Marivirga lumbricoides]
MARANFKLIKAIKVAAEKIKSGTDYQWGHMGGCNCGHLAQELTNYSKREIHEYAMRKSGDWTDQVQDYCSTSQMPMDEIISSMMESGLERKDMIELERLGNHDVRVYMGEHGKSLSHNKKEDVVAYMLSWAEMLENELVESIKLPANLLKETKKHSSAAPTSKELIN